MYKNLLCVVFVMFFTVGVAHAEQLPNIQHEQYETARQNDMTREAELQQRDELRQSKEEKSDYILPEEERSFYINEIMLSGIDNHRFHFLSSVARKYEGNNIGEKGLQIVVKALENALVEKGFVTSRIGIPQQSLRDGKLKLDLVKGYIEDVELTGAFSKIKYEQAFPVRKGDVLNIRSLEQGLEQLKRMESVDAKLELLPGKNPGYSIAKIKLQQGPNIHGFLSMDDGGNKSTGKIIGGIYCSVDNFAGLDDVLTAHVNNDIFNGRADRRDNGGYGFNWSIPDGYANYGVAYRHSSYDNPVALFDDVLMYQGNTDYWNLNAGRVVERSRSTRTTIRFDLDIRRGHNYLEDAELLNQRRSSTAVGIGISHKAYQGEDVWYFSAQYRRGVPWFNPQNDMGERTSRYNIYALGIDYQHPFELFHQKSKYAMNIWGQYTDDYLYAVDSVSIGNRYTVRGFDGEKTLLGDSGFYMRNELAVNLGKAPLELYTALDYGRVFGRNTAGCGQTDLLGTAVGLRGKMAEQVYFDVFAGWPISMPSGFAADKCVYGFRCIARF